MATNYNFVESNFEELIKGVTFLGRIFEIKVNSTAVNLTDASIDIWWRYSNVSGDVIKKLSVGDGVTITDATAGKFQMDSFLMDWDAGTYYYDIKITLASGDIKKYIYGKLVIKETSTN